ncbi:MAG: hypothetical protein EOO61_06880 [Hymenobacter sp.]|nr:MAG: hypothetical protein EOO61_06880 [Hymenobacter sp.]
MRLLKYPLFPLPNSNWFWQDKVLFLDGQVVDERNMPGKSLGIRRLQCGRRDLLPLKKPVTNLHALLHSKSKTFIDSRGKPFIYDKTMSSKLKCYKINRIDKKDTASLLWVHGVSFPFTIPRPPHNNPGWARILHLGPSPWMLYDYVLSPTKDTYRRV